MASRTFPPEVYSRDEIARLLRSCGRGLTGQRNRALIAFVYRTGLRIREALELRRCDVDIQAKTVFVRRGKGGKSRRVGLDDFALEHLSPWLATRAERLLARAAEDAPLFCTLKGGPVQTSYVRHAFARIGRRAGLGKRFHAHGLRHTHATEILQEGWRVDQIRRQLGHANLAVTSRYIDHLGSDDIMELAAGRNAR